MDKWIAALKAQQHSFYAASAEDKAIGSSSLEFGGQDHPNKEAIDTPPHIMVIIHRGLREFKEEMNCVHSNVHQHALKRESLNVTVAMDSKVVIVSQVSKYMDECQEIKSSRILHELGIFVNGMQIVHSGN